MIETMIEITYLVPSLPSFKRLCRIWILIVQIHPRIICATVDHADCAGPIRRHELDHTVWGIYLPCLADLDNICPAWQM